MATKTTKSVKKESVKKASAKAKAEVVEAVDAVEEAVEVAAETAFAKLSKNVDAAQGVAKQIWFAYLGVAGRAYDEVTDRYSKAEEQLQTQYNKLKSERKELVEDLVARGEKVQDQAEARLNEGRAVLQAQLEGAKERLTSVVDISAHLEGLSNKLDSLSDDLKKSA
jgi:hypothetical protein